MHMINACLTKMDTRLIPKISLWPRLILLLATYSTWTKISWQLRKILISLDFLLHKDPKTL